MLLGDCYVEPTERIMKNFCLIYNCKNTITDKICYKNPEDLKGHELMITNMKQVYMISQNVFNCIERFLHQTEPHTLLALITAVVNGVIFDNLV